MPGKRGAQCRVCNSPNRNYYELLYYKTKGNIGWVGLSRKAEERGEHISRKSFEHHFKVNHYTPERIQRVLREGAIETEMEKSKKEAINILGEIKANLMGLKALSSKAESVSEAVKVFTETRLTLQELDRLSKKLSSSSSMTEAELYREFYWAFDLLCSKCLKKFRRKLDERLKAKGYT